MILFEQIRAGKSNKNKTKIAANGRAVCQILNKIIAALVCTDIRHDLILNPYFHVRSRSSILLAHVYADIQLIAETIASPDQFKDQPLWLMFDDETYHCFTCQVIFHQSAF